MSSRQDYPDINEKIQIPGRKTVNEVFDESTLKVLYKLMTHDVFDYIDYPISTGKEAKVFRGVTKEGEILAIKIMRINTAVFRDYRQYIQGDYRFKKVGRGRKMIFTWTKKEFSNLKRMHEGGLRVPEPITFSGNILVMRCMEENEMPAPMLKYCELDNDTMEAVYHHVIEDLVRLIRKVKLVHGDLSEYNILLVNELPYMIDVSQAVPLTHPKAEDLFYRDVDNLVRYFTSKGVETSRETIIDEVRFEEVKDNDDRQDTEG